MHVHVARVIEKIAWMLILKMMPWIMNLKMVFNIFKNDVEDAKVDIKAIR